MFTIKEAAPLLGVNEDALIEWCNQDLVPAAKKVNDNWMLDELSTRQITAVNNFITCGLSFIEIRRFMHGATVKEKLDDFNICLDFANRDKNKYKDIIAWANRKINNFNKQK